ncbi:hypothetical protein ACOMHN_047131 [Nucella lapillus]
MKACPELRKAGTLVCGTIRKDRSGLPRRLTQRKLKKGDSAGMRTEIDAPTPTDPDAKGRLIAVRYNDKREDAAHLSLQRSQC